MLPSLTSESLRTALPGLTHTNARMVCDHIGPALTRYSINTPRRIAAFVAQLAHESALFTATEENLNYSAAGLLKVFPKYFNPASAARYARKPREIANRVYANRMLNGPEASGDGWKFRGKSWLQITGRENVTSYALAMGMKLDDAIAYIETPEGGFMAAGWFFKRGNLFALCDTWEITKLSARINGKDPANGLAERKAFSDALLKALEARS